MIKASTFAFLRALTDNNTREWFQEHKSEFEAAKDNFTTFSDSILKELKEVEPKYYDTRIKDCIFRIYRDVRFSKDKKPYKIHLAAAFGENGKNSGKIDYYFHLQDQETFLGAGIWNPTAEELAKFRQEIDYNPEELKSIIDDPEFKKHFPLVHGEQLKRAPKGYAEDHPEIHLLKYKSLFFMKKFSNEEVLSPEFKENLLKHMERLKPFVDYLNEILYEG
jgi:uncharacterized protein (TIGR02453 family)